MAFRLQRVRYMPQEINSGVLYVSEEFGIAVHLCACGCGAKVRTPLGPTEWNVDETPTGPTLRPSVGNWQLPCRSHYWIYRGEVLWATTWTSEQIAAGRRFEEARRRAYYKVLYRRRIAHKLWQWLRSLFGR